MERIKFKISGLFIGLPKINGILFAFTLGVMCMRIRHILLIVACVIAATGAFMYAPHHVAYADDKTVDTGVIGSADEILLFDLINAARKDPLGMASSLGMDPDEILKNFPELQDILTQGLPPLEFNGQLYNSASGHTQDMLENGYYAYDSVDGRTPADRMNDTGYVPSMSGESLGLLYFSNFINSAQAVSQLFKNIYEDELDPEWTGQRNIISPDMKDIGISIGRGLADVNGFTGNAYILTCDFGAEISSYELELSMLINQARSKPKLVAQFFGMDAGKIINDFPEIEDVFLHGLPPVSLNSNLYNASKDHALDMLTNGYYSSKSKDGRTPEDRIRDAGYLAAWSDESRVFLSTCYLKLSPQDAVKLIFKRMFVRSFGNQATPDQTLFSEMAVEAGVGIAIGENIELGDICGDNVILAVADYAAPETANTSSLMGIVYSDENGNGLFDQGEGLPGVSMEIKAVGSSQLKKISTNPVGGFSEQLPSGRYRVAVDTGNNETIKKWITINKTNIWLPLEVQTAGN